MKNAEIGNIAFIKGKSITSVPDDVCLGQLGEIKEIDCLGNVRLEVITHSKNHSELKKLMFWFSRKSVIVV